MTGAIQGRLVGASFVRDVLLECSGTHRMPAPEARAFEAWIRQCDEALGPASAVRAVADVAVLPLLDLLGLEVAARHDSPGLSHLLAAANGRPVALALATAWNVPLHRAWPAAVRAAIDRDVRWILCCNGTALRLVDGRRTWTREYLEFDLARTADDDEACTLLWTLVRAETLAADPPLLDAVVDQSVRHGLLVCRALADGVLDALRRFTEAMSRQARRHPSTHVFDQSLTVLYRLLFLLFAEARGLVPLWHPVYRDRYSLDGIVSTLLAGRTVRGLWAAVQAISRLAHAGCRAGALRVTAFNGRLFAPAHSALLDAVALDDGLVRDALLAVSTTRGSGSPRRRDASPRRRIVFADLDVEQLGAVYEQVLEYEPPPDAPPGLLHRSRDGRKASGTFYTPKGVTAALVERTLEPLVRGRDAEAILSLRVLDPAMGSGAFLVAAGRYLALAAEDALVRDGHWHAGDVTGHDRVSLRRTVASRCLYGVDLNPTAVHLGRLSLWLATLAADRPLSFLDHHLVAGNSLVGATPDDLARQPGGPGPRSRRPEPLPLFPAGDLRGALHGAADARRALATQADDSAAIVRQKERTFEALQADAGPVGRWRRALDLWCAGWFWPDGGAPDRGTFRDLCAGLLGGRMSLPPQAAAPLLERAAAAAARHRFLHWPLVFPEVFPEDAPPGFDAIVGNPPWDMVRGDSGESAARDARRSEARQLTRFVREAGIYTVAAEAHVNRYQLFLERGLQLLRPGGRLGFVLPGGLATDTGAAPLRRHLFDRADVDAIAGLDNRRGIFPIHRSVRFVLLTCTAGRPTDAIACRFGVQTPDDLVRPATGAAAGPFVLTRRLIGRLSGEDDLGIPELAGPLDLQIVERMSARWPRLASPGGWHVTFGRELNATEDRRWFEPREARGRPGWPVVEGKHLAPFRVALDACDRQLAAEAPVARHVAGRPRLAYRDVASATNRLTLIAAIVPGGAATTHTLFCLKTPLPLAAQHALCGLLNSFVANYLVRLRVGTHVTAALVSRLFVPRPPAGDPRLARLAALARMLGAAPGPAERHAGYVELQAIAAVLYGLRREELDRILDSFPLVDAATRDAVRLRFDALA